VQGQWVAVATDSGQVEPPDVVPQPAPPDEQPPATREGENHRLDLALRAATPRVGVAQVHGDLVDEGLLAHGQHPTRSARPDVDPDPVRQIGGAVAGERVEHVAPPEQDQVPLPPFEQLRASLDGLSKEDLKRFRQQAVPEPGPFMREPVHLQNDSRRDVPSTMIACSYPSEVTMQMAREGPQMMAEVATLRDLELVDLPTGHWPMWSRPAELALTIANAAGQ